MSYAWGDSDDQVPLSLGTGRINIPKNLMHGLKHMRSAESSRFLWADAICIDQNNVFERNHQVSNMLHIYKSCWKVVVWLGQDLEEKAAALFELLERIAQDCPSKDPLSDVYNMFDLVPPTVCPKLALYAQKNKDMLDDLFGLPWFHRLWVVQEVNGTRNTVVQWGFSLMSWHVLALAASYLGKHTNRFRTTPRSAFSLMNVLYMRGRGWHDTDTILHMLFRGRRFQCSDERDHVYGFMGMPAIQKISAIEIDYNKSTLELFQQIAILTLVEYGTLDVLSHVDHSIDGLEKFPSWIPQWNVQPAVTPIIFPYQRWRADRGQRLRYTFDSETHRIVLSGVCLDTIVEYAEFHGSIYFPRTDQLDPSCLHHHTLMKWLRKNGFPDNTSGVQTDESLLDLGNILCCGSLGGGHVEDDYERFLSCFTAYVQDLVRISRALQLDPSMYATLTDDAQIYELSAAHSMRNRCLLTTAKGYRGCGRSILQYGDKICVLFGGRVPYILRPMEGYYKLIGEAYIPEFMFGKAIDMLEAGELQEEEFELR